MSDPYGMDDALAELEAENPLVYTYAGADYPCLRGDATMAQTLGFGGYAPGADLIIVVRVSTFAAAPSLKSEITLAGRMYLLDSYRQDPNEVFQVWALSDPQKAA